MTTSLRAKILIGFLSVSLAGTVLALGLSAHQTANEFGHFLAAQSQETVALALEDYYRTTGDWSGVAERFPGSAWMPGMHPAVDMHPPPFLLVDPEGRVLIGGAGHSPGDALPPDELQRGRALEVGGQRVGAVILEPGSAMGMGAAGTAFLQRVNQGLLAGAAGGTVAALIFAALLAGSLTRPLRNLTEATRAIARGDLGSKVQVVSEGEVGELAASFNHMSDELARTRDLRRQLSADVAHELRTPLSIILGHAEALRDGVLPPSRETLGLIHDEALRLSRMVEDLRTLSLAEAGELSLVRVPTPPGAMLERAISAQTPRARVKRVELSGEGEADLPAVAVDPDRIAQVLDNLLENALRHAPEGGRIEVRASRGPGGIRFSVSDNGPGIRPEDLPRVFERFYRTDPGRSRELGGSGLGLAIARSIVEAHAGKIWAESSPGQGAVFSFDLPI